MSRKYTSGANRIPSSGGFESRGAAARVFTRRNVIDGLVSLTAQEVQQGIEFTKRGLAVGNKEVVQQRDYARRRLDIGSQQRAWNR